jgi:cell division protein FtsZ
MIELGLRGVDFIAANTDHQALEQSLAPVKLQLGPKLTRGLGAGGNPEVGYKAAQESRDLIRQALQGADMVFLTAGMGGGTGTGSIAVAGEVAQELGAVTIAIVTTPFSFEMGRRQKNANDGLTRLRPHTDTLIAIPNDRLLYVAPRDLAIETAFRLADDVLRQAVQGIAELITEPGVINVDFAHIRQMMRLGGGALMAIGQAEGEDKARKAVDQALNHPLLESISLQDAAGVIANFSGSEDLSLFEVGTALNYVQEMAGDQVDVVLGVTNDERLCDRTQVILIVTGLGAPSLEELLPGAERINLGLQETKPMNVPEEESVQQPDAQETQPVKPNPIPIPAQPEPAYSTITNDLDMTAFMRRRDRYAAERDQTPSFHYLEQDR